jgi:hypothetical protein
MSIPGQTDLSYREKVVHGVISAIVDAGAEPGAPGGYIDLHGAVDAMCAALATVVMQSGEASTPKLRRETADYCRTEIAKVMKAIADGAPIGWALEPVGDRN